MFTPFKNDIFGLIWEAFKNLYPDKDCECYFETQIRDNADGEKAYGLTDFDEETGGITLFVDAALPLQDAAEIFAHELAHVAVGIEHDHDEEWENAFEAIFVEYNRVGEEIFSRNDE